MRQWYKDIRCESRHYLALHCLLDGEAMKITLRLDPFDKKDWMITGRNLNIRSFFKAHNCFNLLKGFTHIPIHFIDQLSLDGMHVVSWTIFKYLLGSRPEKWFSKLYKLRQEWFAFTSKLEQQFQYKIMIQQVPNLNQIVELFSQFFNRILAFS